MKIKIRPELLLLALLAFLAPLLGGHVSIQAQPLLDASLLTSIGGAELPLLTRFLLTVPLFAAMAIMLAKRRVLQVPSVYLLGSSLLFVLLLAVSLIFSNFLFIGVSAWLNWVLYVLAFFLTVAAVGRVEGPRIVLAALAAGCAFAAIQGILEYASMRSLDPSHRIFGTFNNPNAMAGMMILGLLVSLGLMLVADRLPRLLAGSSSLLCGFALVLTGSRGGFLAAAIGILALVIYVLALRRPRKLAVVLVPVVLVAALGFGLQLRGAESEAGAGGLQRVGQVEQTATQSVGFRINLWRGALQMIGDNPLGYGIGSYRFESTRPGITQQTVMTHQTYLQLGASGGVAAMGVFLAFGFGWLFYTCRGSRALLDEQNLLRAGCVAAFFGLAAHGFIESNLFYLGIGLGFFIVLGVGLQLSADGGMPELAPGGLRLTLGLATLLAPLLALGYYGLAESLKVNALTALQEGDLDEAQETFEAAKRLAPGDADLYFFQSALPDVDRLSLLEKAAELEPSPRRLRAYALELDRYGETAQAITTLESALRRDPNNIPALALKYQIELRNRRPADALETAWRLAEVTETPYYQVRAIPEYVPTEPFEAMVFLAGQADDAEDRQRLLERAVAGFEAYRQTTVPLILQFDEVGLDYLGETTTDIQRKMAQAAEAAGRLAELYEEQGNLSAATEASEQAASFRDWRPPE
jgi:O-antigen ligase